VSGWWIALAVIVGSAALAFGWAALVAAVKRSGSGQ
jgi:hypothetical protein